MLMVDVSAVVISPIEKEGASEIEKENQSLYHAEVSGHGEYKSKRDLSGHKVNKSRCAVVVIDT